jgi:hypothetical protein
MRQLIPEPWLASPLPPSPAGSVLSTAATARPSSLASTGRESTRFAFPKLNIHYRFLTCLFLGSKQANEHCHSLSTRQSGRVSFGLGGARFEAEGAFSWSAPGVFPVGSNLINTPSKYLVKTVSF